MHKWILAGLMALLGGCGSLQYHAWSPSVRTFADDPKTDEYYVGADAKFVVVTPGEKRIILPEDRNTREVYDAWNKPIAGESSDRSTGTGLAGTNLGE